MRLAPIPLVGGAYQDDSRPYDQQDSVNYFPETAHSQWHEFSVIPQSARSPSIQRGVPGLRRFVGPGDGPVRGLRNVEGLLFIVRGASMYQVSASGALTNLGAIPGVGRCPMTHNTIANGYQVTVINGQGGYVYNTVTATLAPITDSSFPGSIMCDFSDNYIVHLEPYGRYWFISNLADATSFDSTNTYQAEASPDRIVSLIVDHKEVQCFGARTVEMFVDDPDIEIVDGVPIVNSVFKNLQGVLMQQGCAGLFTVKALDNSVVWLGNDGILYNANGYTPVRISTHAFEQAIIGLDWAQAYAFTWIDHGHKVYYITFPDGHTWGYDAATGMMHRRQSYGRENWRISDMVFWNNQWIAGDAIDGRLYVMDWNAFDEDGSPLVAERTAPYISESNNRVSQSALELILDTGMGALNGDNYVNLTYSDDGGRNYKNWKQRSLGAVGQYGIRVQFRKLGQFRNRIYRVQISSPVKRDIIAASGVFSEAA